LTDGKQGMELVRILEASSESLKHDGAPIELAKQSTGNGSRLPAAVMPRIPALKMSGLRLKRKKHSIPNSRKPQLMMSINGSKP
jgi:hypothetical protein